MTMTKIGRSAAAVLCAGTLAVAAPEVAEASAPSATHCLSGVYRLLVRCRHTPTSTVCAVKTTWTPFVTTCEGAPPA
ncbi:hypothetical protein [Amycolatopsis sp. NPDC004378]